MLDSTHHDENPRRRFWMAEVLLIVGILAFGGFALLSDARMAPSEIVSAVGEIFAR